MDNPHERFTGLFERCTPALLAYCVRRCPHPEDAADAIAETFTTAWRRLDDVPTGEGERPWLFAVARNVLRNQHRSRRRRHALDTKLLADVERTYATLQGTALSHVSNPSDTSPALNDPDSPAVAALHQLKPDDQEILRLLAWEQLDHAGIATVLGLAPGTVRVRLHRARARYEKAYADVIARTTPRPHPTPVWGRSPL